MVNKYWCMCVVIDQDLWVLVSELCGVSHFTFSADIQFWNSRQSLEGLSVRSIIFGVFQSLVVLLYILDNETNFVVQVSVFIGLLIDFWKITKVMDVRVRWCHCQAFWMTLVEWLGLNSWISVHSCFCFFLAGQREQDCWNFPTIDIQRQVHICEFFYKNIWWRKRPFSCNLLVIHQLHLIIQSLWEMCVLFFFSQMAFKYLSWLLYPLFGCYAVYSLLYVEHKGWYSWVLSMLYGFLLTFGKCNFTSCLQWLHSDKHKNVQSVWQIKISD